MGRAAGAVLQLLRAIALDEEEPARLHRALEMGEEARALGRRRELDEDRDDDIEAPPAPVPGEEIGLLGAQPDAALGRQLARLREADRGEIDRQHVEPLLGEKDAVAALA